MISFRVVFTCYFITRNEISFLSKWLQWLSFRIVSCKQLQEIDKTPKCKYFISPEMKSHVNTLTICIFIVWYHILISWKWVDFFVDLLNLLKMHNYLTQLKTILFLLENGKINGKQILMTLTTKNIYVLYWGKLWRRKNSNQCNS